MARIAYSLKDLLSLHLEFVRPKLLGGLEDMKKLVKSDGRLTLDESRSFEPTFYRLKRANSQLMLKFVSVAQSKGTSMKEGWW